MIRAVIFDFNGVLVDDESVHFDLFREVLGQEGVEMTEDDYHERYLGLDDRGCFEAALTDAGQPADRDRLDDLIARKARRYVEVAARVCGSSPAPPSASRRWPAGGPWRSTRERFGPRSSSPWAGSTAANRSP